MYVKLKTLLFTNQTLRQTIAKNTFWLTVSNIGGRFIRAFLIIYAARVLGAEGYGTFAYAISLTGFFAIFTDLGIGAFLTREAAQAGRSKAREEILGAAFAIKMVLLALGALIILFIAPSFTKIEEARILLPVVAFVFIFDSLRDLGISFIRALERMEIEALLYLLTNIAIVIFGFLSLQISTTPLALTWAYAIATGIGTASTAYTLRHYLKNLLGRFDFRQIKSILISAWPFAFTSMLGTVMINTDIILIGFFRTAGEVGSYSVADRIIQMLYIIPGILATSTFPALSRLARAQSERARVLLERLISIMFLLSLPIAVGGILTANALIILLFGNGYAEAVFPFQILLSSLLVRFPSALLANTIFAYDGRKQLFIFAAIGSIGNLLLDILLIPRFGIAGAAWTTLITQLISTSYLWNATRKILPFSIFSYIPRMAISAILMGGLTWILTAAGAPLLITIALSAATYAGLLWLFREPLLKEFKLILQSYA